MTVAAAPLVPADVDLRNFAFMPLEGRRLLTSETWILGTAEERCAALALWIEAWHQVPAASLPDNDRALAHLSQAGARWPRVRAHALRGWVKATDGRLYHPVIAEKALEAWSRKHAQRDRTAAARTAREARRLEKLRAESCAATISVTETVTGSNRQGQGHRKNSSPPTPHAAAALHENLIYPARLAHGQRMTVDRIVSGLSKEDAQLVLDELDGASRYGRTRVEDPMAFLITLVSQCRNGTFAPSHANRVQAEREEQQVKREVATVKRIAA